MGEMPEYPYQLLIHRIFRHKAEACVEDYPKTLLEIIRDVSNVSVEQVGESDIIVINANSSTEADRIMQGIKIGYIARSRTNRIKKIPELVYEPLF